jgi:hypothetical protein
VFAAAVFEVVDMERSLFRVQGEAGGWACSNCRWRLPVPTLLSGEEAMAAYDRLAAAKFREHKCELEPTFPSAQDPAKRQADSGFAERARTLIKRGYKPKVAVELVLHELEIEHGRDRSFMERARADSEDFLDRIRKGLI